MKKLFVKILFVPLLFVSQMYSQNILNEAFMEQFNSNSTFVDQLGIDLLNKNIMNQVESGNDGGNLRFQNGELKSSNITTVAKQGNNNSVSLKQNGDNN